jgi:hypothetical protein
MAKLMLKALRINNSKKIKSVMKSIWLIVR